MGFITTGQVKGCLPRFMNINHFSFETGLVGIGKTISRSCLEVKPIFFNSFFLQVPPSWFVLLFIVGLRKFFNFMVIYLLSTIFFILTSKKKQFRLFKCLYNFTNCHYYIVIRKVYKGCCVYIMYGTKNKHPDWAQNFRENEKVKDNKKRNLWRDFE